MLLVVLVALGCGGDDEPPLLHGELCDRVGSSMCDRAAACQLDTYNSCFQGFKRGCCLNAGKCNEPTPDGTLEAARRCQDAMPTHSCQDLQRGVLPAICLMN